MNSLFEYADTLNAPYEAFEYNSLYNTFPVKAHWHYFVEIIFVISGRVMVSCDKEYFEVDKDQVFIFPPTSVHAIFSADDNPVRYYVLKFDLSQLETSIHSSESGNIRFTTCFPASLPRKEEFLKLKFEPEDDNKNKIHWLFQDCIHEMNGKNIGFFSITRSHICEILIFYLRRRQEMGLKLVEPKETKVADSINTITEYIDAHLSEDLKVEMLAKRCNMSYSYFAKCFADLYGQSCKHYISFLRLCKAENMLIFTDYDLTYISQETGFCDCSHLIHAFKEKNNMTPHQFRKFHRDAMENKK